MTRKSGRRKAAMERQPARVGGLEAVEAPTDPQSLASILAKKDSRSG
jgi:hypothetical protein